jgi:hypothetical protein
MRVILKILIFLMTLVLIYHCKKVSEPGVTIHNDNFLKALINLGVEKDRNGIISPAEAELITFLDVSSDSISDMTMFKVFDFLERINQNTCIII